MLNEDISKAKGDTSNSFASSASSSSNRTFTVTRVPAQMCVERRRQFLEQMVEKLPVPVKNRLTALKNMQMEHFKMQADFAREVLEVEAKHSKKLQPLMEKRKAILTGEYDPPTELPMWKPQPMNELDSDDEAAVESYKPIMERLIDMSPDSKGLPNFWLTVLLSSTRLSESVTVHDEPALKKLKDIRCVYGPQQSFTLEFHFEKNEYFSNDVLTKQYFRKCAVDDTHPFGFEGAEITHCKGCEVKWKPGKNLTKKTLRKRGGGRCTFKHFETESFFKFFDPPNVAWDEILSDDEDAINLSMDFEMADFYRTEIIPNAVLYYSGEILDDAEDEQDENDEASDLSGTDIDNEFVSADEEMGATEDTEKGAAEEDTN